MFQLCFIFILNVLHVGIADGDIDEGAWNVLDIKTMEKDGFEFLFDITRNKVTRTEDAFNAELTFNKEFDETYGLRADIYKYVDGGSKLYQKLSDESFVRFLDKNAKNNVKRALEIAEIDPPEFPVKSGNYTLKDYVVDYCEMPKEGPCGRFTADVFIVKNTEDVGGLTMELEFECGEDNKCASND